MRRARHSGDSKADFVKIFRRLRIFTANPLNYDGFLKIDSAWAWAILVKHIVFGLMALIGAYSLWGLGPAMTRLALLESRGKLSGGNLAGLRRREELLNRLNFVCALAVLALTAVARSV